MSGLHWADALKWRLNSIADWFQERACWRTANAIDRLALALHRRSFRSATSRTTEER